jgi:hypothetical protein
VADIEKMASRPREYLSGTGLPLLAGGLVFIILGGGVLIQRLFPRGSVAPLIMQWIGICCAGAVLWGAKALRRRIVFPRGGYVVPRVQPSSRAILLGNLVVVIGLAIFAGALPGGLHLIESRFIPPGFAICVAITLIVEGWRQKRRAMMWCSVYFAGLAALLGWMPGDTYAGMSALQLASGILMAGAGAVTLTRFLKENPILAEPKDE